eukprot:3429750-Heterocapsa_arctica.AAC.1
MARAITDLDKHPEDVAAGPFAEHQDPFLYHQALLTSFEAQMESVLSYNRLDYFAQNPAEYQWPRHGVSMVTPTG